MDFTSKLGISYVSLNILTQIFLKMKVNLKITLSLMVGATLFLSSCERDDIDAQDSVDLQTDVTQQTTSREPVTDTEILDLITSLEIDSGQVTKGPFIFPDGSSEERIYIGDDIVVTRAELEQVEMVLNSRQYRTINLVTGSNRTINILGYTGNDQFGLSNRGQTALQWAVNNYNRLGGVTLQFNLTYGTNFNAADMVVYDNSTNNSGSGGVAGFPDAQGRPNKFIQIYNLDGFSTNVNEHVITHEIGHSVGFRHSDWFDRLSCPVSSQGNEGTGSDGAIHVPGTPTGRDLTSVMQACFSSNEDGEFNANDVVALQNMY